MELYSNNEYYKLYKGNMLDLGEVIEPCSIDAVLTDPPYELNFMGKGWDNSGIAFQPDTWKRCLEALKPGGYLLAFGGSRTYHRIACAIEDAGFEIRDCIMWLYGSGFPKSMNIGLAIDKKNGVESKIIGEIKTHDFSKHKGSMMSFANTEEQETSISNVKIKQAQNEWNGWGTALKPSYEPIIVARKPLEGSCTDNVIKYGVGGINIDECRVGTNDKLSIHSSGNQGIYGGNSYFESKTKAETHTTEAQNLGRFPANTILTYGDDDKEEVCSGFPNTAPSKRVEGGANRKSYNQKEVVNPSGWKEVNRIRKTEGYDDNGGSAARYFYCAKASKRDRDEGLPEGEHSTHPTVKPTDLMQYLVRLVTPNGGTVLDPFNGSGSTGKAVMYENKDRNKNYKYIGIELTEEYLPIAKARIEYVINKGIEKEKSDPKQEEQTKQRKESALF